MTRFTNAGVQPFGVNPAGADSHSRYAAKMGFGFPLLSDPERAISRSYGVLKDDGVGIQRSVYAIRRDGIVVYAVRGAPAASEILASLGA